MRSTLRPDQLKSALKVALKERGFQYSDLAEKLGCSLPTVKRFMGSEELSLSRLLEICDLLEIGLGELEGLVKADAKKDRPVFTEEQEEFFDKNPGYLTYFSELHQYTPSEIAKRHGLTKRSTDLYLIRLEKIGLIRVDKKGRVRLRASEFPSLRGGGVLARKNLRSIAERATNLTLSQIQKAEKLPKDKRRVGLSIYSMTISPELFDEWSKRLNDQLMELDRVANFEMKFRKNPNHPMAVFSLMKVLVSKDDPDLRYWENTLGEIKNL